MYLDSLLLWKLSFGENWNFESDIFCIVLTTLSSWYFRLDMLVGGPNKVNGTPTKKVSFVTNGDQDDENDIDFDIDFEDDNELSVDGGGVGLEVTPEVSERAERLEKAKQNPNVSILSDFCQIDRFVAKFGPPEYSDPFCFIYVCDRPICRLSSTRPSRC